MQDISALLDAAIRFHNSGNLVEAERRYRHILSLDPAQADAWHLLGLLALQAGHPGEAEKLIRHAITRNGAAASYQLSLGNVLMAQRRFEEALAHYRAALARKPDMAEAHNNLGSALKELGRLEDSLASHRKALSIRADFADAYNNLGNVLGLLNRPDEAVAAFRRALGLQPNHPQAHNNLGNALAGLGRLDEAEASLRQALRLAPNFPEAHANLGQVLKGLGRSDAALVEFHAALALRDDMPDAHTWLARLLAERGEADAALPHALRALQLRPSIETQNDFVEIAQYASWQNDSPALEQAMVHALVSALAEPWGHPEKLIASGWRLARRRIAPLADPLPAAMYSDALIRALLTTAPLCDIATEKLFVRMRRGLLAAAEENLASDLTEFYGALARQCFLNEYVFAAEPDEEARAERLAAGLECAIADGAPIAPLLLTAVASYRPLHTVAGASRLLERDWPPAIRTMLEEQIVEPESADIPSLTPIEDSVSRAVRQQYEENPYPRWTRLAPAAPPQSLSSYIAQRFPKADAVASASPTRILIAGCGTGRQAIKAAWMYENADVLALDLSLASLGYAWRKTKELGVTNLTYAQADLLRFAGDGTPFDAIEAVGMLHHMQDPWAAWRKLLALLRPGGVMKLGFYSSLARRDVARARAWIAAQDYAPTPDGIRRFRHDVMTGKAPAELMPVAAYLDFYSLSAARDLLFHVQETSLDLPAIRTFLADNRLQFLGFDCPAGLLAQYRARFPDDPAATNLEQWHAFENDHPDSFRNMYQFWVQKAG